MTGVPGGTLPLRHALLALAVVAVWGSNFVVIKAALATMPPLLLGTLRYAFAFLPAALFVARPDVPWRVLAGYGGAIGAGQFGLLFVAMRADISPGLASLVIQTQVFWTIGLAVLLGRERPKRLQWVALALAAAGLGVVAWHTDATTTPVGLGLVLTAALCWGIGNTVAVSAGRVPMLAFMVWSSACAVPPLLVLSLLLDGPAAMTQGLVRADAATWAAVVWQSVGNTLFGYGAWAWLMARHSAATVSPMALLVPVFGLGTSALVMAEPLQGWKIAAAALVIGGLALNMLGPRLFKPSARAPTP